jgi:ABC-type proline/glycine betaine transport system substrate-binding protein
MLDTIIGTVRFAMVLIDGGSALSLLFSSALAKLGLSKKDLAPVNSPFWGFVLG